MSLPTTGFALPIILIGMVILSPCCLGDRHDTSRVFKLRQKGTLTGGGNSSILYTQLVHTFEGNFEKLAVLIRTEKEMILEGVENSSRIDVKWRKRLPGVVDGHLAPQYPAQLTNSGIEGLGNILLARVESGLRFYQVGGPPFYSIKPLHEDRKFADVLGWTDPTTVIQWGNLYPTKGHLGILTRQKNGTIVFYSASFQAMVARENFPVRTLSPPNPLQIDSWWTQPETDLRVEKRFEKRAPYDAIIAQGREHFSVYKFDRNYQLERIIVQENLSKSSTGVESTLIMANLTNSGCKDALLFNATGLYIWAPVEQDKGWSYVLQGDVHQSFSKARGWRQQHLKSIIPFDVDGDGLDEILYYGPAGFGIRKISRIKQDSNSWTVRDIPVEGNKPKFSYPKATTHCGDGPGRKSVVLLEDDEFKLKMVEVDMQPTKTLVAPAAATTTTLGGNSTPSLCIPIDHPLRPRLELNSSPLQKWTDWFHLWENPILSRDSHLVDPRTGHFHFTFPLFSSQGINLRLSYHSLRTHGGLFGVGWNLPIGKDYITLETQSSIFEEAHTYVLSLDGSLIRLNRTYDAEVEQSTHKLSFNADHGNVKAYYFPQNRTWEVVALGDMHFTFGGEPNAVQTSLVFAWGHDDKLQGVPMAWYLTQRRIPRGEENQRVNYTYKSKTETVKGIRYTSGIYLDKIVDQENSIRIKFDYVGKKQQSTSPINPDGTFSFPVQLQSDMLVKSISATTFTTKQLFHFNYSSDDTVLHSINQLLPNIHSSPMPIVKFQYGNEHLLSIIEAPSASPGVQLSIKYEKLPPPSSALAPISFPLGEMGNMESGPGFLVRHSLQRIYHPAVRATLYAPPTTTTNHFEALAQLDTGPIPDSGVKTYSLLPYDSAIFILVEQENGQKWMALFSKDSSSDTWSEAPTRTFSFEKKTEIVATSSFVACVTQKEGKIRLFDAEAPVKTIEQTVELVMNQNLPGTLAVAATKTYIAIYDDVSLTIVFKRGKQYHTSKFLAYPGMLSSLLKFYNNFNLTTEARKNYIHGFSKATLKVAENFIILSTMEVQDDVSYLLVILVELSPNYTISRGWTHKLRMDRMLDLTYDYDNQEGSKFTLKYEKKKFIYNLIVDKVAGKVRETVDKIRNINQREDALNRLIQDLNGHEQWGKLLQNTVILPWGKYESFFSPQGLCVGESNLISKFDGSLGQIPNIIKIQLGPHLTLVKEEKNGGWYHISRNNDTRQLQRFQASPAFSILPAFPSFIAYQKDEDVVLIQLLMGGAELGKSVTFPSETLHLLSSSGVGLVTIRNNLGSTYISSREIVVRPPDTLQQSQIYVGTRVTLSDRKNASRVKGYEYSTGGEKSTIIPGGEKILNGWMDIHYHPENGTVSKRTYDTEGNLVKSDNVGQSPTSAEAKMETGDCILRDRREELEILSTCPYTLKDDMVSFLGFEEYEKDLNKWMYDQDSVVRSGVSLTGESFLNISTTTGLEATFSPNDQGGKYTATCWVRQPWDDRARTKLGEDALFLKVIYYFPNRSEEIIGLYGKIQEIRGDWVYAAVDIDLLYAVEEFYSPLLNIDVINFTLPISFKIRVESPPNFGSELHVDNIAIYPTDFEMQAAVYNTQVGIKPNPIVTQVVGNGGNVKSIHYDQKGTMITHSLDGVVNLLESRQPNGPSIASFESEAGFYEPWEMVSSFRDRWQIEPAGLVGISISNRGLHHSGTVLSTLTYRASCQTTNRLVRLDYSLGVSSTLLLRIGGGIGVSLTMKDEGSSPALDLPHGKRIHLQRGQEEGELLVLTTGKRLTVWLDGAILFDQVVDFNPLLTLGMMGSVIISSLFILNDPSVQVEYLNGFSEKVQEIRLETVDSAIVKETLYDHLGRAFLKSKETRIQVKGTESLLQYQPGMITSFNQKSGRVEGKLSALNPKDEGFPYYIEEYEKHPQGAVLSRGTPGKDYTLGGIFGRQTNHGNSTIPLFIQNLFPPSNGFSFKSRASANSKETTWVYRNQLLQAVYVKAPMFDHRLTTYEYNDGSLLTTILPPSYHEEVDTFSHTLPWQVPPTPTKPMKNHGTFFTYNQNGMPQRKKNREEGTIHFMYDNLFGKLRFRVYQPFGKDTTYSKIVYSYIDPSGVLLETGLYTKEINNLTELNPYLGTVQLPAAYVHTYQGFAFTNGGKQVATYNEEGSPLVENLQYDESGGVRQKSILVLPIFLTSPEENVNLTLSTSWINPTMERFCYPYPTAEDPFCLMRKYNRLGLLTSVTAADRLDIDLQFEYNARGQVISENSVEKNKRSILYNSPGFMTSIEDPFISMKLSYQGTGYTQPGIGAGIITSFDYKPKWKEQMNRRTQQLDENHRPSQISKYNWRLCLNAAQRTGYLTKENIPTGKPFNLLFEYMLPVQCRGKVGYQLGQLLVTNSPPSPYSYKVDYGSHGEVLRAKYIETGQSGVGEDPLQPNTLSRRIPGILPSVSGYIWDQLVKKGFIVANTPTRNVSSYIGYLSHLSLFKEDEMVRELRTVDVEASQFSDVLLQMLVDYLLIRKQSISYGALENSVLVWSGYEDAATSSYLINQRKALSGKIYDMIIRKGFAKNLLHSDFLNALGNYKSWSEEIAKVLLQHHGNFLGNHPFDWDMLNVDINGNVKTVRQGHSTYDIVYRNDSVNQIQTVIRRLGSRTETYTIAHDTDGNVVSAGHKRIREIRYHPITKRPTTLLLEDGTKLVFTYDGQGERVLKQVYASSGYLTRETWYFRDERGRVLTEKRVIREEKTNAIVVVTLSHLIYGPRGLIGFVRDGVFYGVIIDHLGSVRCITKGNQVVVSYDYSPYGELQKSYVGDPDGELLYRFGGKEYDEESGLYNFHARLYDPTLGRFFQTDPMWQYSSPYIYAGNSPFSLVDPDGEEIITLIVLGVIGAGIGGYLGGAAVNNRWNPLIWDYSDPGTYLGIGTGTIAGAFLPVGFAGSIGALGGAAVSVGLVAKGSLAATVIGVTGTATLGAGVAYLTTAGSNNNWNPGQWEWDRPHTYNALFQGFTVGSSLPAGVKGVGKLVNKIAGESTKLRVLLHTSNFIVGGAVAYGMGVTAHSGQYNPLEWEWGSPATWSALSIGAVSGYAWPTLLTGSVKGINKLLSSSSLKWNRAMIKAALKNPKSPIYKTLGGVVGSYLVGSAANEDFDPTEWKWKSFTTYQGILNGAFMGKAMAQMVGKWLKGKPTIAVEIDYKKLRSFSINSPEAFQKFVQDALKLYKQISLKYKIVVKVFNKPKLIGGGHGTPGGSSHASSSSQTIRLLPELGQQIVQRSPPPIRADRQVGDIPCLGGSRRKRAFQVSCLLKPDSIAKTFQNKFIGNIAAALATHAVTTYHFDVPNSPVKNNEVVHLNFQRLVSDSNTYVMVPLKFATSDNIAAYYIGTKQTITIPASPAQSALTNTGGRMAFVPLVVTPPLQGCSLYVRYNAVSNTLDIFHHLREFEKGHDQDRIIRQDPVTRKFIVTNPENKMTQTYDDVFSWEEYVRPSATLEYQASSVFIYFDHNLQRWSFGNQMLSHDKDVKHFHREGFRSRLIYGIPGPDGETIAAPPYRAPHGA